MRIRVFLSYAYEVWLFLLAQAYLSLLWAITALPLATIPVSTAAVVAVLQQNPGVELTVITRQYFKAFGQFFRSGLMFGIAGLLLLTLSLMDGASLLFIPNRLVALALGVILFLFDLMFLLMGMRLTAALGLGAESLQAALAVALQKPSRLLFTLGALCLWLLVMLVLPWLLPVLGGRLIAWLLYKTA